VGVNGIITTVAGNGTASYSGDGGAATNAELNYPIGVAVDSTGNQFISDSNHRIRKVGTNGIIYTVAGNGTANYSGDVGAATNAELNNPFGVTVDATGNLFIADSGNQRIRMVGTNEIITTVAGNGTASYSGDGGAATNAELFYPYGVTVDATGNLLIADSSNNRIRKVGTNEIITTVAGNGTASYSGDGGAATNAELYLPYGVAVDASGNLFIADERNNRIRKEFMQGPTLVLNNVGIGNAGAYDVVVSNPYGSVTSSVVNLTITVPVPVFQPPIFNNGQFMLAWSAVSNGVYQLQYKTNLLQTNWVNVGSTITASNTVLSATNAIGADQQRFYRVQQQ
jgi:sugar lactone lactonase YvrE